MVQQRGKQRTTNVAAKMVAVGLSACLLVGCVGFGIAFANGAMIDNSLFASSSASAETISDSLDAEDVSDTSSSSSLTQTAYRDISQGIETIEAEEEAAQIAAEEAAAAEEAEHIAAAEAAKAEYEAEAASDAAASELASLSEVDWSVGKDAFIAEWTERIDAYLEGSELEGLGSVFAEAAWEYGVDPRWSPAIANTESSKGESCFEAYNAWGWMDDSVSWSSWTEAIYAHVEGLSEIYGYSITYSAAQTYCPPNYEVWFSNTLSEMLTI